MRCDGDAGPEDGDTGPTERYGSAVCCMHPDGGDEIRGGEASCPDWVMRGRGSRADYHFLWSESRMKTRSYEGSGWMDGREAMEMV